MALANKVLVNRKRQAGIRERGLRSFFPTLIFEMASYGSVLQHIHSAGQQWSSGVLWPFRTRNALAKMNGRFTEIDLEAFEAQIGPYLPTSDRLGLPMVIGRLGQSIQQGTKRRLFSMGHFFNQRLLHPLHQWCADVLKVIPMDGTFNQEEPLDRLIGNQTCYCVDRVAIESHYAHGTPIGRTVKAPSHVVFCAGQPLGLKSSWPLFALSHHFMVWYAAHKVYPYTKFDKYAVLGDDVIICDDRVAAEYLKALEDVQVQISVSKSLVSHSGAGEFAKRFRVRGLSVDLSPISFAALLNYSHPYGLCAIANKYRPKRFSTLCRIGVWAIDHCQNVIILFLVSSLDSK